MYGSTAMSYTASHKNVALAQDNCVKIPVHDTVSARNYLLGFGIKPREVHAIFEEQRLTCAGGILKRNDLVSPGMVLELRLACSEISPSDTEIPACRVVYEDGIVLACDKQAGILVHSDGKTAATLTDAVQAHLAAQGIYRRAQAVQRIDVPTTGLVLFSTAREFQPALDEQVASGSMHKRYLAIVRGTPSWKTRHITAGIGRDRHHAQRMRVCAPGQGKYASTYVRVLAHHNGLTLLEAEIETGRRHQIRVHLASVGYPILGDTLYGDSTGDVSGKNEKSASSRIRKGQKQKKAHGSVCADDKSLMLHAWREEFVHPLTHVPLTIRTAWPERFEHLGFYEDYFV